MTVKEVLQSAQFVVNNEGRRTAVLLNIKDWETLIDWIETISDTQIAIQALSDLDAVNGRPEKAGWFAWDDVKKEWND